MQPDFKYPHFELHTPDEIVGVLRPNRPGSASFLAQAADGSWLFTQQAQIVVTRVNKPRPLATFQASKSGGILTWQNGRRYTWLRHSAGGIWSDSRSRKLIHLEMPEGLTTDGGHVVIAAEAAVLPDLSMLILFGWYLLVLELDALLLSMRDENLKVVL